MTPQTLEGTWEEIALQAEKFSGKRVRLTILPEENGGGVSETQLLPVVDEQGVFHRDRWEAVLRSIERRSQGTPVLPAEALTREALYQDHD